MYYFQGWKISRVLQVVLLLELQVRPSPSDRQNCQPLVHPAWPAAGATRRSAVSGWCALPHTAASLPAVLQCSGRPLPLAGPPLVRTAEKAPPCRATRSWLSVTLVASAVRAAARITLSACGGRFLPEPCHQSAQRRLALALYMI